MAAADNIASGSGDSQGMLRRALARTARRLRHGTPTLSVIVLAPGHDSGLLAATLSSVRDQPSPEIEIVVVTYAGGAASARAAAGDDTRTRFFSAESAATARSTGFQRSRGRFVLVAAPGDVYPAGVLVDLLEGLDQETPLLLTPAATEVSTVNLAADPFLAAEPYLGRLLLPRRHLRAAMAATADQDHEGFLAALVVLRNDVRLAGWRSYRDVRSDPPGPFVERRNPFPSLPARIARDKASLEALNDLPAPRSARARAALAALRPYLVVADVASEQEWIRLVEHAAWLRERVDPLILGDDVVANASAMLAADGHRDAVVGLASKVLGRDFAATRRDGRVIAELPVPEGLLGEDDREVSALETPAVVRVRRCVVDGSRAVLELFLGVRHFDQSESDIVRVELIGESVHPMLVRLSSDPAVGRWFSEDDCAHDAGLVRAEIDLGGLPSAMYALRVLWSDGEYERASLVTEIAFTGSAARSPIPLADGRSVGMHQRHGRVALGITGPRPAADSVVQRVEVDGQQLRLTLDRRIDAVWLEGEGQRVAGTAGSPGFWTVPMTAQSWGMSPGPLTSGTYRFVLESAGRTVPPIAAPGVVDLLPVEHSSPLHRIHLHRGAEDRVLIKLDPLLAADEIGPRAQRSLQREYAASSAPLDPRLVYFQSFTGQWANDNPLAIQAELARLRPDLDLRWVVADSSATVPPGATPLLFRSREWYDVITRASYVVTNIELEKWFRRRPGQQILQTFHGYPSKAMGLGLWRARGLSPHEIQSQLERTSGVWNTLVTPTAEMDQYYRRDYAYDGRILSLGYPRNDALVGESAIRLREETRERLGIRPDQRAVLYAPTWRDDLATNFRAAEAVHHLDVNQAAVALGEDYVLLMRGHRFHAPERGIGGSQVIDVTRYPDINHLIVAADVAVLDYSSLRFDFALTGRPMVFLVPDLASYGSRVRGFLWDYRETAPGPLVSTTAEVVDVLRDLDAVALSTAADLAAFNARYNSLHDGHAAERVVAEFFAPLLE